MSSFLVQVVRLAIEPHDNADALEIARIGGYASVVRKDQFQTGDLVAYIPEQSIVPAELLEELGLTGRLAGSQANRVKAIRLRGVLSQGICYPARPGWVEGQDVTEDLGIVKYTPPIPTHMSGELISAGLDRCMRYDIENLKRYPEVFEAGEPVVFSEKIHGTWCQLGVMSEAHAHPDHGRLIVSSKGLASQGLAFDPEATENAHNLYLRVARKLDVLERLASRDQTIFVLGEVFGQGVQDLGYGASSQADETLGFRAFDVYVGVPGSGAFLSDVELGVFLEELGIERAPVLYRGPYSEEAVQTYTNGRETVSGKEAHVREGIVIRPQVERRDLRLGRVQLKSVSAAYLLRKGGTEYN